MLTNRNSAAECAGSGIGHFERVAQNRHRLSEANAMLGQVRGCLVGIPFELHLSNFTSGAIPHVASDSIALGIEPATCCGPELDRTGRSRAPRPLTARAEVYKDFRPASETGT